MVAARKPEIRRRDHEIRPCDLVFRRPADWIPAPDHELTATNHDLPTPDHEIAAPDHDFAARDDQIPGRRLLIPGRNDEIATCAATLVVS